MERNLPAVGRNARVKVRTWREIEWRPRASPIDQGKRASAGIAVG